MVHLKGNAGKTAGVHKSGKAGLTWRRNIKWNV